MGRMEVIFVSLFEHQIRWQSQRDSGKRSNIGTIMILNPIQGGWSLISSSIHYFFEEFLPGLGITVNLDKVLVHMYGMDGGPSLLEVQLVIGDDQAESFQKGSEAYDDATGSDLDIAAIGVLVQKEQVVDFNTGRGDLELWGANATQGDAFFQ